MFPIFPLSGDSDLGNAALSGQLVPQLGQLKNLQYLYVVPCLDLLMFSTFFSCLLSNESTGWVMKSSTSHCFGVLKIRFYFRFMLFLFVTLEFSYVL